jgi:hypothetical protein
VDGFVIMKPHELEMSHVNYLAFFFFFDNLGCLGQRSVDTFRFDHLIMCLCIYLSFFLL